MSWPTIAIPQRLFRLPLLAKWADKLRLGPIELKLSPDANYVVFRKGSGFRRIQSCCNCGQNEVRRKWAYRHDPLVKPTDRGYRMTRLDRNPETVVQVFQCDACGFFHREKPKDNVRKKPG